MQHFFGLIRHAAGSEDHPTASMFVQLYRLLSVYSLLRLPRRRINSYVSPHPQDAPMLVVPRKSATKRQAAVHQAADCIDSLSAFMTDERGMDAVEIPRLSDFSSSPKDAVVFYVSGFVIRHCRRVVDCERCMAGLCGQPNTLPAATLINIKLRGALQWPSEALFASLREAEDYIAGHLEKGFDPESFFELLEEVLPAFLTLRRTLCELHAGSVCAEIVVYYLVTRLHWHVKQINKSTKSATATKGHRKKAKLC